MKRLQKQKQYIINTLLDKTYLSDEKEHPVKQV
jgi:hypothetical protein